MSDTDTINTLNSILLCINQVLPIVLLIMGTFGHICNIIIFSKRSQRTNPISFYFLCGTITNLIVLYSGVLLRYLQDIYNIDPVNNILNVCKIRSFFLYLALSLSSWYILLATIDRYLISSEDNNRRQLSTVKNAYRITVCVTIIFILCYCHILILYNIQSSLNSSNHLQNFCYPRRGPYRIFSDVQLLVQFSLLPPVLMSVFVILIMKNIRTSHNRMVNTVVAHHQARIRKRDIQLSKMLLLQVIITIVCSLPFAVSQLAITMTLTWTKTPLRLTIESFCSQITRHLAFSNCCISFYLYTLAGSQFRLEIRHIINRLSMIICHKRILEKKRIGLDHGLAALNAQRTAGEKRQVLETNRNADEKASNDTAD